MRIIEVRKLKAEWPDQPAAGSTAGPERPGGLQPTAESTAGPERPGSLHQAAGSTPGPESPGSLPPMAEVSARLDELGIGHEIGTVNWQSHTYRPEVRFNIAYGPKEIYIKYYVREAHVKAEKYNTNEMVCEDSCVEFFVSPEDDGIYYNFEFNPIGTALMGSGHGRHDSIRTDPQVVDGIRRLTTMGHEPFPEISGDISWSLTVAIPLETFFRHKVGNLAGRSFRANFYKCGDKLSNPHFVTWNPVETEKPDYHRPEYFGMLKFI